MRDGRPVFLVVALFFYLLEDGLVHELVVDLASEDEEVRGRGITLALALVADQLDVFVITCLNVQMFKRRKTKRFCVSFAV
jgi:hypothetical protein